jgi:hypothetical protein
MDLATENNDKIVHFALEGRQVLLWPRVVTQVSLFARLASLRMSKSPRRVIPPAGLSPGRVVPTRGLRSLAFCCSLSPGPLQPHN